MAGGLGAANHEQLLELGSERHVRVADLLLALGGLVEELLELSDAVVFAFAVGALGLSVGSSAALQYQCVSDEKSLKDRIGKRIGKSV